MCWLLGDDSAGLSYDQEHPIWVCTPVAVGARRDRIWGVREPEEPDKAQGSLAWETKGDIAAVTKVGKLEKGQLEKVTHWLGCPGLL